MLGELCSVGVIGVVDSASVVVKPVEAATEKACMVAGISLSLTLDSVAALFVST